MVVQVTAKFLLCLLAIGAAAQEPTIVAKPTNDYIVSDGPTPAGNDVIVEPFSSGIKVYLGPDRASALKDAIDKDCANIDAKCVESARKALSIVPNQDGLQKRIIPLLVGAAVWAAGAFLIEVVWLHKSEQNRPKPLDRIALPTPTNTEVWASATAVVFKPDANAEPTKVVVAGPPAPTVTVGIETVSASGDTVITLPPGNMKMWASAAEQAICPRDDGVDTCLRLQNQHAVMAALLNVGIMELIRSTVDLQIIGNIPLANLITDTIKWAKTLKTLYSETDLRRLVQIISIYIWKTFSKLDVVGDVLTIIEVELNRMTLKKGKVKVSDEEEEESTGCDKKFDPKTELAGFDALLQQIQVALEADPDYLYPKVDDPTDSSCPKPDPNFSNPSLPQADVATKIKEYCKELAQSPVGKDRVHRFYDMGMNALWLSMQAVTEANCGTDLKAVEETCASNLNDALFKCAVSGKIFASTVVKDCISYNIYADIITDSDNPPWNRKKGASCGDNKLSKIPFNFFSGIYPAFCQEATKDGLEKTLTNAVYKKPTSRKRAPPISASDYDGYQFHMRWTGSGGGNCQMDCNQAFAAITGKCGDQVMTHTGSIDAGCGFYSYAIEAPGDRVDTEFTRICFKQQKEVREDPSKWAWGQRDAMYNDIKDKFCELDFKDPKYANGVVKETYDHDHDTFEATMDFHASMQPPSKEQCMEYMVKNLDECDADPVLNQHNVKWGAKTTHTATGNTFEVKPTWPRVAPEEPNWECNTWASREEKQGKGKSGTALPPEIDDQMMKLQCVHQKYNDMKGRESGVPHCGLKGQEHYSITVGISNGYLNTDDCWRYNFPCLSRNIMTNKVTFTATHWPDGHKAGMRCWIGFDNY